MKKLKKIRVYLGASYMFNRFAMKGKASQLPFLERSFKQEIVSKESDSKITEFHPWEIPSRHPYKTAMASTIATQVALTLYLHAARKLPSASLATTPRKPKPSPASPPPSTLIFTNPTAGGDQTEGENSA